MTFPTFPNLTNITKLKSLIGPKSWVLFHSLKISANWLHKPFTEWQKDSNYKEVEIFLRHVKVVNDLSERAAKLMQDFATSISNDEEQKQFLLHNVEFHSKEFPSF